MLLLALLWDSRYLERLREQERRSRDADPVDGVRFWTKGRVRAYTILLALLNISGLGATVLALSGLYGDSVPLRTGLSLVLITSLVTLFIRVWGQVTWATREPARPVSNDDD
ncbi:hypothetical protein BJF79_30560 [Actinomadura sp. CNU-125]|nr:hypothetical protein BJF79_30560 [Actinomadura sp. CNU-125]